MIHNGDHFHNFFVYQLPTLNQLNYNFHVETFTWQQAGQMLRSNGEGGMASSCLFKISYVHPLVPRVRVILLHLKSKRKSNLIIDHHWPTPLFVNFITIIMIGNVLFNVQSPQICSIHPNPHSPSSFLPQSKLERGRLLVATRRVESRLLLQGGESAQKKGIWIHHILRQRQRPIKWIY